MRVWCDVIGLFIIIVICCKDCVFYFYKFLVVFWSGYLKKLFKDVKDVIIFSYVFGGLDILDLVFNFCYGFNIFMDFFNIVEVCCVVEYL